ncbi:hypothetical protein Tco_1410411 [Tanacetum coccineum]
MPTISSVCKRPSNARCATMSKQGKFTSCEKPWSSRYDMRGTVGASLGRARNVGQVVTTSLVVYDWPRNFYEPRIKLSSFHLVGHQERRGRFTSCEETWSSRYDVRETVGAGLRRARKVSQVATTCEEPSGQVYDVRVTLVKSLRRARNRRGRFYGSARKTWSCRSTCEKENSRGRFTSCEETWSSRYDVRGTVGAGLRRARKLGQVATTCEKPSGQVYVVRGKLVKSLRRARNRRGRFTTCSNLGQSRLLTCDGTVGAGIRRCEDKLWVKSLRRARETVGAGYVVRGKDSKVATKCEEPSGQVYVVRGNLVKSLRRARNVGAGLVRAKELVKCYGSAGTVGAGLRQCRGTLVGLYRRARNLIGYRFSLLGSLVVYEGPRINDEEPRIRLPTLYPCRASKVSEVHGTH